MFLPGWVRARGRSMYNIVFTGGQAIGGVAVGLLAQWWGLVPVFVAAATVMALGTTTVAVWPLRDVAGLDRDLAGLAGDASRSPDVLVDGYAAGSLSMTAYTLDAACPPAPAGGGGAAALPDDLDPEDINV